MTPHPTHTRRGTPLSWVVVAASFVAYVGLVFALGMTGVLPELPLPWWIAQAVPPIVYTLAIALVVRPPSATGFLGGVLLLWAVHLLLGMLTEPIFALIGAPGASGMSWAFPPSPLPQLLWVPVLLLPLRQVLRAADSGTPVSGSPAAPNRRPLPERRPAVFSAPTPPVRPSAEKPVEPAVDDRSAPATARPVAALPDTPAPPASRPAVATPVTSMEARFEAAKRPVSAGPSPGVTPAAPERSARQADVEIDGDRERSVKSRSEAAASRTQRIIDDLLAKETSDEPMRVSAHRVLAQLPAGALAVSGEALAEQTGDHAPLVVPRRLVLAQLVQGVVRVEWDALASQIEPHLLAMSHDEIKTSLPDGRCVLPLDELVRQVSPEMFSPVGPAPDVKGIEVFAAPFQPLSASATAGLAPPPAPAPSAAAGDAEPERAMQPVASAPVALSPAPVATSLDALPAQEPARAVPDDTPPDDARMDPACPTDPVGARVPRAEDRDLVHRVASLLPLPVGPLLVDSHAVHGTALLTATSPALGGDIATRMAALVLPVVTACRRPWPVDQITLHGPRAVVILTPLAPFADGGPVLAVAVPTGGSVALLELRCRQAAGEHAARPDAAGDEAVWAHDDREEPDLLDVESSTRTHEVASSLGALGTVTASTLRDADADRALYLFLPPGSDVRALGAIAHDVSRVMRTAQAGDAPFRKAVLRSGGRRMVVRLSAASSEFAGTVVAAGETARPGLAYRQVERAAAALGAL